MKTTIAKQLKIKDFPFIINDKHGNEIYYEDSDDFWIKREYDAHGNLIRYETSNLFWIKREYDAHGNCIRYENSDDYWSKRECDVHGKEIYCENSDGVFFDNRSKKVEVTLQQIADKMGIKVEQLRIKD